MEVTTKSVKETFKLGKKFAKDLKPMARVFFFGELGAGKTEFIKGVCAGLGYQGRVLSPTFQLVREYKIIQKPRSKNQDIILKIYHADLYRLERRTEIETIGLGDYLADKEAVVLLEWAERLAPKRLPKPRTEIKIEIVSENVRKFDILNV